MKISLIAAFTLLLPVAAATAEIGPANSTNQHQRDAASFYDNVPDSGLRSGRKTGGAAGDRAAAWEGAGHSDHRRVTR